MCDGRLPDSYLNWLFHAGLDVDYALRYAIEREWTRRFGDYRGAHSNTHSARPKPILTVAPADMSLVQEIIDRGYRAIALAVHPDTGGSTAAMQWLNDVVAALRSQIAVASR